MKANNSIEKPDWSLIGKYLSDETNATETKQVEQWAAASVQNQNELDQHRHLLHKADEYFNLKCFDTNSAWNNINRQISPAEEPGWFIRPGRYVSARLYKYAAILLIGLLIASAGYYLVREQMNPVYAEIVTGMNEPVKEIRLPDGSTVTLNSNSRLEYPEKFADGQREVTVTGEAFFDVMPDRERPFIITAGDARVKVLGTSFNVNAFPGEEAIEVTVETGIVQVSCCEEGNSVEKVEVLLNAGERGTFNTASKKLQKEINTDPNYMAWKTRSLVFEKTRLSEVTAHLNKVYRIDVEFENKELGNLLLTAEFDNKSAEFILDVIRLTFELDIKEENGIYTFSDSTALNK